MIWTSQKFFHNVARWSAEMATVMLLLIPDVDTNQAVGASG